MYGPDDADLARAAAAGDRAALAAIYDRYADRLFDFSVGMLRDRDAAADCVQDVFVTAAMKLGQLREADRLRPWLYAIARSECLARIRARKREHLTEELPDVPSRDDTPDTIAVRLELADLVRAASAGLSDRDRVVLELSYRQGLAGPELADALGVTARNANTLVERLRDTFARSLGALLISRQVRADPAKCPELAALLADWDGQFSVLMRKRIARHVDDCAVCDEAKSRMVNPAALLATAPVLVPAPAWLRERVLQQAVSVPPSEPGHESWWPKPDLEEATSWRSSRKLRAGIGAAAAALAIGAGLLLATTHTRVVPTDAPTETPATSVARTAASTPADRASTSPPAPPPPPPQPPATSAPETTAIPRTQAPPPPPSTTPPPFTRNTQVPVTTEPTTTRTTPRNQEPENVEPSQEPVPSTPAPSTPKTKPPVSTIDKPPPVELSPDEDCTPQNPCAPQGPPVFS